MDIRHGIHPEHAKTLDTEELRREFLIEGLFQKDALKMVYSHIDRIITGGICPVDQRLELTVTKELGVDYFFQRREMGIINIGATGSVWVDGKEYPLDNRECLYVGMGPQKVAFTSAEKSRPAKFYFNSTPAHTAYPVVKLTMNDAQHLHLGTQERVNVRDIYQFIHPKVLRSCQLVMGMTVLAPGSSWNSMPATPTTGAWRSTSILICRPTRSSFTSWASRARRATSSSATNRRLSRQAGRFIRGWGPAIIPSSGDGRREPDLYRHGRSPHGGTPVAQASGAGLILSDGNPDCSRQVPAERSGD